MQSMENIDSTERPLGGAFTTSINELGLITAFFLKLLYILQLVNDIRIVFMCRKPKYEHIQYIFVTGKNNLISLPYISC